MKIGNFVGNNALKGQLISMFANNKVPHAIILEGEPGTGKKTFANIIATFAVCEHFNKDACYECNSCKKALSGMHPDIILPEKAGVLQAVSVSEVRRIKQDAYVVPNEAPYKVYIFTDIDNMGIQAQNSLLKVLEEPPGNVIFIFTCVNLGNILPTVRSRAQIFKLGRVKHSEAVSFILKTYKNQSEDSVNEAVTLSCGNIGKAIEFLNEDRTKKSIIWVEKIVDAISERNAFDIMVGLGKTLEEKKELKSTLNLLYLRVKDGLLLCAGGRGEFKSEASFRLSKKIDERKLFKVLDVLDKSMKMCDQNVNKDLIVTYICGGLYKLICT